MATVLANRVTIETPIATNDEAYAQLVADPSIPQFQPTVVLTTAGINAAQDADILVKADEHWVNKHWRPAMGWMYMVVCIFDFILFPILWSILQAVSKGQVTNQWQPLTLQGAGLFHLALGAVLGVAAYGRTKEKLTGTN